MDYSMLGQRIKEARLNQHLTQEKMAEIINITQPYLGQLERGERKASLETVAKIAKSLNVSIDYIVFGYLDDTSNAELDKLITLLKNRSESEINLIYNVAKTIIKQSK